MCRSGLALTLERGACGRVMADEEGGDRGRPLPRSVDASQSSSPRGAAAVESKGSRAALRDASGAEPVAGAEESRPSQRETGRKSDEARRKVGKADWENGAAGREYGAAGREHGSADRINEDAELENGVADQESGMDCTQLLACDGVEEGEAENEMATLAFNPGFVANDRLVGEDESSPRVQAMDARMVERMVEGGDADLMMRLKAGDLQCFDVLMNKYRRQMVHFMFRMVRNQAVAEEMAQEVFLRVYRARETYRAEAKFTTWLYRIATNLAVNYARDTRNERLAPKVMLDEPEYESGSMPDVADSTPSIEADLLRRERMKAIKQHVMALPERQRMAVLMHKYQEMDYKGIGAVLKLSESATKSLLFRAYQTLREKLKDFV